MKLHHGSDAEITLPNLNRSRKLIDFGLGFYTTTNRNQAISFAKKIQKQHKSALAIVSTYDFDETEVLDLKIKHFGTPNFEWLEFITNNRLDRNFLHEYDIVIGPVANDDVFGVLQAYFAGFISAEATIGDLKIKKLFDQVVFCSDGSLNYLKYIESEKIL